MPEMLQFCGRRFRVGQAGRQAVRHDQLVRDVPHGPRGAPGRRALRRSGPRRLPGRLPRLLEGGLAQAGRRRRRRGRPARRRCPAAGRGPGPRPGGDDPQAADPAAPGEERTPARRPSSCGRHPSGSRPGTSGSTCSTCARATPAGRHGPERARGCVQRVPGPQPAAPARPYASGAAGGFPFIQGQLRKTPRDPRTCAPESWCGSSPWRRSSRRSTSPTATAA